jgi:hypothetical protein
MAARPLDWPIDAEGLHARDKTTSHDGQIAAFVTVTV